MRRRRGVNQRKMRSSRGWKTVSGWSPKANCPDSGVVVGGMGGTFGSARSMSGRAPLHDLGKLVLSLDGSGLMSRLSPSLRPCLSSGLPCSKRPPMSSSFRLPISSRFSLSVSTLGGSSDSTEHECIQPCLTYSRADTRPTMSGVETTKRRRASED